VAQDQEELGFPPITPAEQERRPPVDDNAHDEPRPRGALVLIMIYLLVLAAFWLNTYLRIWRS
jgi:hypothetical protein